jgi:GNAT superfamily N-acetyltransferase
VVAICLRCAVWRVRLVHLCLGLHSQPGDRDRPGCPGPSSQKAVPKIRFRASAINEWLLVNGLWVDDCLRHRGIGTELMMRAENHAIARGCHSVWLRTFQARGFYEAVGYELFGMLDNHPAGQKLYFLRKRLIP